MVVRLCKTPTTKTLTSLAVSITTQRKTRVCQELEEELARGRKAAADLVEHFENMGAGKVTMPIETDNGCYRITIIKTL